MSRPKKDNKIRREMCARLIAARELLGLSTTELARALGYANATTITKVQRGEAFLDVERLYLLAKLRSENGQKVDLNWLISGQEQTNK